MAVLMALVAQAKPLQRFISVPHSDQPLMATDDKNDLFAKSPKFSVTGARQIVKRGAWSGESDYSANMRVMWAADGVYFRFDIRDDVFQPTANTSLQNLTGDYILLHLLHGTAGPEANKPPVKVLLLPNPQRGTVSIAVESEGIDKQKLGRFTAKCFLTAPDSYSIILRVPTIHWNDPPQRSRVMGLQVYYGDSDVPGVVDSVFAQFPRTESTWSFDSSVGTLHFVDKVWSKVYPAMAKFNDEEVTFLLDYGNLSIEDMDLTITLRDSDGNELKVFKDVHRLPANSNQQDVPVKLDLSDLPSGMRVRVDAKAGIEHDPATFFIMRDPGPNGLIYCPDLVERRSERKKMRPLEVTRDPALIKETFRYLAGGGDVIWHVGAYDGSSAKFPERIRPSGPSRITIPSKTDISDQVPWALFGGADHLDKMNEPLIINFDGDLMENETRMTPEYPGYSHIAQDSRARNLARNSRMLLLIGVLGHFMNEDQFPTVRVSTLSGRVLLNQKLRATGPREGGHAYALRVWLDGSENGLKIENISPDGPRVEIDYMALVSGGPRVDFDAKQQGLQFTGPPEATQFSHILASSLYFSQHYLVDSVGKGYSSPPGGRYQGGNLRDMALLMTELAHWDVMPPALKIARNLPFIGQRLTPGELEQTPIGYPMLITGLETVWRKSGRQANLLDHAWSTVVERHIGDLLQNAQGNPYGLISGGGEFGTPQLEGGSSIPLVLATRAALQSAIRMAEQRGERFNAQNWREFDERLAKAFDTRLVAPPGGQNVHTASVYPAAHGLGESRGVQARLPEKVWIYARNANGTPIPYNGDVRVFDTPYLLAGLSFWIDGNGYSLTESLHDQLNRTRVFLLDSPLLKDPVVRQTGLVSYKSIASHLWMVIAGLMLDNQNLYSNLLNSFVRYNFDEYALLPPNADIELSPYTVEENIVFDANAVYQGGSHGENTAMTAMTALKVGRLLAGVDDFDDTNLKLMPRLPMNWRTMKVNNWLVCHKFRNGWTSRISYSYERMTGNRYSMVFEAEQEIPKLTVRLGPFPGNIRSVNATVNGAPRDMDTVISGGQRWVVIEEQRCRSLTVSVRPVGF